MSEVSIQHNREAQRFEISLDGHLAYLQYQQDGREIAIVHTEVPAALGGRGLGGMLAKTALQWAKAQPGMSLAVGCPFVREYMRKHPE
jgi:predicted GNAT family acetyltransferase